MRLMRGQEMRCIHRKVAAHDQNDDWHWLFAQADQFHAGRQLIQSPR